jgi:serine/threonine-protein kinase
MSNANPGEVLAGKYRVERVLGQGGMGTVVAAYHLHLGSMVAIKRLLPEALNHPDVVARFLNEGRSATRIQSEHVARVLDVGTLEGGEPFMVMEYLEGQDLARRVRKGGPLPIEDAVEYVLQACEALAEAHVAGIVHRDLKPGNLFLTQRADGSPCVKVLDFGISKAALTADQQGQFVTQTASVLGTPGYMAPEQLRSSKHVDARTDIWALGVILQELLTGKLAFQGSTVPEVYAAILGEPPVPLRQHRPDAPPALEAVIQRCLEKDPARRFASVGELGAALLPFAPARARLSAERIGRITGVSIPQQGPQAGAPPMQGSAAMAPGPMPPAATVAATGYGQGPQGYAPTMASTSGPHGPQNPYGAPGPQQGYGPGGVTPQQPYGAGYGGPSGYGGRPGMNMAPQAAPAPPQKMHPAAVALIIIGVLFAFGLGSCTLCVCVGAANAPQQNTSSGRAR